MPHFGEAIGRLAEHLDTEFHENWPREDLQPGCISRIKDGECFFQLEFMERGPGLSRTVPKHCVCSPRVALTNGIQLFCWISLPPFLSGVRLRLHGTRGATHILPEATTKLHLSPVETQPQLFAHNPEDLFRQTVELVV